MAVPPKIYVDGDGCPVKEDIYRVAGRYHMEVLVVCNSAIRVPKASHIQPIVVGSDFDAVDNWIAERVSRADIVVTNDLLLADRCLRQGALVTDPRGRCLDENKIGDALATRELMQDLRAMGAMDLGPKPMKKNHRSQFLRTLDELVHLAKRLST